MEDHMAYSLMTRAESRYEDWCAASDAASDAAAEIDGDAHALIVDFVTDLRAAARAGGNLGAVVEAHDGREMGDVALRFEMNLIDGHADDLPTEAAALRCELLALCEDDIFCRHADGEHVDYSVPAAFRDAWPEGAQ
jgi:hypothetical protein